MALEAAGLAVAEFDPAAGAVLLDSACCDQFGIERRSATLTQSQWLDLFEPSDRLILATAMGTELDDEATEHLLIQARRSAEGPIATLDASLRRLRGSNRLIIVLRDVTSSSHSRRCATRNSLPSEPTRRRRTSWHKSAMSFARR